MQSQEAEAGDLWVQGQPSQQSKFRIARATQRNFCLPHLPKKKKSEILVVGSLTTDLKLTCVVSTVSDQ